MANENNVNSCVFTGFTPHTLQFFTNLSTNNSQAWFESHRQEYEEYILQPLRVLVDDLSGCMLTIDPELLTGPERAISRIHRDTRFARDKSPYKTSLWITFKRQTSQWRDTPSWFIEITADSYRYGMGFYSASKGSMDRLREAIQHKPAQFRQAVRFLEQQDRFVLEGEQYRRVLRADLPEDLQQWHQRKNLYLVCNRRPDQAFFTRGLADDVRTGFEVLAPFYHYLWDVASS